jgi:membrane protein
MAFGRASRLLSQKVWAVELGELSGPRAALYRHLRLVWLAVRGFVRDDALHRASALAFDTILGLLPLLALLVSALKGFGAYRALVQGVLRPAITDVMVVLGDRYDSDVVTLRSAFMGILDLVDRAEFGTLGIVGLVLLVYIVVLMLVSVEQSLNHVFDVEKARSITRRIADYSAILFITPLCIMVAAAVTAAARRLEGFGGGMMLELGAIVAAGAGFTMLYVVMPFTKVRVRSALYGGFVAGILWFLVLLAHVHFQLGVARYNALYSTFAALPLFLVWVFLSWIVVLFGAELTAAHQNTEAFRWRVRGSDAAPSTRLFVALRAMAQITEAFVRGRPAPTLGQLRRALRVPGQLIADVLDQLARRRLVLKTIDRGLGAYAPARDVDTINVSDICEALEDETTYNLAPLDAVSDRQVQQILEQMRSARARSSANLTARELAAQVAEPMPSTPAESWPAEVQGSEEEIGPDSRDGEVS